MAASHTHIPLRPVVIDLMARARAARAGDPLADERYFLDQLRAAFAGEAPADRLRDQYGVGLNDRLCRLYARYDDCAMTTEGRRADARVTARHCVRGGLALNFAAGRAFLNPC